MGIDRRTFLKGAAAGAGLTIAGSGAARAAPFANLALPGLGAEQVVPGTPIETVVVVMMENRSVDHFLGWRGRESRTGDNDPEPGGRGDERSKGRRSAQLLDAVQHREYPDLRASEDPAADFAAGNYSLVATEHWGTGSQREDFAGCDFRDPGHGWNAGRVQGTTYTGGGEPEGWLTNGSGNDEFAVSFYEAADIPVAAELVRQFTTFDRYFCSVLTSTYPNREYMHSAQSGGIDNNDFPPERGYTDGFPWPTIWTTLEAKRVTWRYYFSNLPVIGLWGPRHAHGARFLSDFYADAATGRLPQVSFLDPWFVVPEGLANDDHPHADIRLGQQFLSDVIRAFVESPQWESGALFLTYDEWGGFWDHAMPPQVDDPRAADGFGQVGFRVPTLLVSPYARGGRVDHGVYDHTSILKFIETNWALPPLSQLDGGARDAGERNIGHAFDFASAPNPEVDVDALRYVAPAEARIPCELRGHTREPSDLWSLAESGWLEAQGFRLGERFADTYRDSFDPVG